MSSPTSSSATHPVPPLRRPYHGSCHCGHTRYIIYLALPPAVIGPDAQFTSSVRFYKCNCTTCHKMGLLHVRPSSPPHDFVLLAPLDLSKLGDYMCSDKIVHWYFCGGCGVRCFGFMGEGEFAEVDLGKDGEGGEGLTKVWRPKEEGWNVDEEKSYLTVNALTIEQGQDGFDLREVVDKKWMTYMDVKENKGEDRNDYPHEGGTW